MGKAARQQRRQAAQVVRAQMEAEQRRKRMLIVALTVVGVLALGTVALVVYNQNKSPAVVQPTTASVDYGFVTGTGPVKVDTYVDFMCPACKAFETTYSDALQQAAAAGQITWNTHPVAILNRMSQGTDYSTRAGAASVCAANDGKFSQYATTLFEQQPAENTTGMTNAELATVGTGLGLGQTFTDCVNAQTYASWIDKGTEVASDDGLSGTPYLKINGEVVEAKDFGTKMQEAIAAAAPASSSSS